MTLLDTLLGRPAPVSVPALDALPAPQAAPSLAGELRTGLQLARLARAAPWLLRAPRGHGEHVIDLPGWRAPEASNAPLRGYLRILGYESRSWGLGVNRGNPAADARALIARLRERPHGERVGLVGWSLGGVVAREIARELPERVACVVTYGTPVVGGPTYTVAARVYGVQRSRRAEALAARLDAERPIAVPITAIFTRADGVVDWRACIDRSSPHARHVEVRSTHVGLGFDPDVWWTVAGALAEHLSSRATSTTA